MHIPHGNTGIAGRYQLLAVASEEQRGHEGLLVRHSQHGPLFDFWQIPTPPEEQRPVARLRAAPRFSHRLESILRDYCGQGPAVWRDLHIV